MFYRRKPNKSGTYSVEVVSKIDGKNVVVQRFGTSRDETILRSFERKAQQWISDQHGPKLPFSWEKDDIISDFISSLSNSQVRVQGPELVYGSIYDQIGYDSIEDPMFRHLVVCRLFSPGSKLKTKDYLQRYLNVSVTKYNIYLLVELIC